MLDAAGTLRVSAGQTLGAGVAPRGRGQQGTSWGGSWGVLQAHSAQGWHFKYPQHECLLFTGGCGVVAVAAVEQGVSAVSEAQIMGCFVFITTQN